MALGLTFLMLILVIQIGAASAAREAAAAATAAAATRAARPGADLTVEQRRLEAAVEAAVPGATRVAVRVERRGPDAVAAARFRWVPPGPDWIPLTVRVESRVPVVVAP